MQFSDLVFIDSTGYHYADYPTMLQWLTDQFKAIYGDDVYLGNDSQDGQLLAVQAQSLYDAAVLGAATYNSFSPATAQGVGLSRNVKINGLQRQAATHSTVELTIVGTAFTTLTNAIASDSLNQQWAIPSPTVIPGGGSITVTATAIESGALVALPNTITTIFTPTRGWQTVNNAAAATPGVAAESDAALRARQAVSTADPSLTVFEGTIGAVENTAGVSSVRGYENDTGTTDSNGIPAHSISIVAVGGLDTDIANAIALHKTPGTRTYGTTNVPTVDAKGMPLVIHFYRPTDATVSVEITLTPLLSWIGSNEDIIAAAVAQAIAAVRIGGNDLGLGASGVSFSQLFGVAYVPGTSAAGSFIIEGIRLKKNAGSFAAADVDLNFNELAVCDPTTNITFILL